MATGSTHQTLNLVNALAAVALFLDRVPAPLDSPADGSIPDRLLLWACVRPSDDHHITGDPAYWTDWVRRAAAWRGLLSEQEMRQGPAALDLSPHCTDELRLSSCDCFQLFVGLIRDRVTRYGFVGLIQFLAYLDLSENDLPVRDDIWLLWQECVEEAARTPEPDWASIREREHALWRGQKPSK